MSGKTLVDQSYWDNSYRDMLPSLKAPEDALSRWLRNHIPPGNGKPCVEIGCYPGRYLAVLGELSYQLNGMDLTPGVTGMKQVLATKFNTGEFIQADFLEYHPDKKFNLVSSFGFIEHFSDWQSVLLKHASMVDDGGMIVVETPNFRGWIQQILHRALDGENLRRHNLEAMQPDRWAGVLREAGFEITWQGYFGKFEFWFDNPHHNFWQRMLLRLVRWTTPLLKRLPEGRPSASPYAGIIAVKRQP